MALSTKASRTVTEGNSVIYTAILKDAAGVVLPLASIDSITLTLYDVATGTIINSRTAQDVLNTNQVTIHATSGLLTWSALPADMAIVGTPDAGDVETHVALFECVYSTTKGLNHEVTIYVQQLTNVS